MLSIGKDSETWLVHRVLEQRATERPDHAVMHWDGQDYTYAAINREANRIAEGLAARGIESGQRCAVMMQNTPAHVFVWFATAKLGVVEMPYFMVPRFIEFRADLPRKPTQKVRKVVLREEGITPATWDREAAGFKVTRDGLARRR